MKQTASALPFDQYVQELNRTGEMRKLLVSHEEEALDWYSIPFEKRMLMELFAERFQNAQQACFDWEIKNATRPKSRNFVLSIFLLCTVMVATMYQLFMANLVGTLLGTLGVMCLTVIIAYMHSNRGYIFKQEYLLMDDTNLGVISEKEYALMNSAMLLTMERPVLLGKIRQDGEREAVVFFDTGLAIGGLLGLTDKRRLCQKIEMKLLINNDSITKYRHISETQKGYIRQRSVIEFYWLRETSLARLLFEEGLWNKQVNAWIGRSAVGAKEVVRQSTFVMPVEPVASDEEIERLRQGMLDLSNYRTKLENMTLTNARLLTEVAKYDATVVHQNNLIAEHRKVINDFANMLVKQIRADSDNKFTVSQVMTECFGVSESMTTRLLRRAQTAQSPQKYTQDALQYVQFLSEMMNKIKAGTMSQEEVQKLPQEDLKALGEFAKVVKGIDTKNVEVVRESAQEEESDDTE